MDANEIRAKLGSAQSDFEASKIELEKLKSQRARRATIDSTQQHQLDNYDEQIARAKANVENLADIIDSLKPQLQPAEERENANNKLYSERKKKLDPNIKKKSEEFVKTLQKATKLNQQILAYHQERLSIEKQTGRSVDGHNICGGFRTLALLAALAEGESRGVPRSSDRWTYWFRNNLSGSDRM